MAEKIIMLACSAGMSTSMLVAKMQEEAKNRGKDYEIFAKSVADIDHQFETKKARCIDVRTTSGIYES